MILCRRRMCPVAIGALMLPLATLPAFAQSTARVSVSTGGAQGDWDSAQPALSADGRFVAFVSGASNIVPGGTPDVNDVYVRDRQSGQTVCVSLTAGGARGNADSDSPAISADGRYVAFRSYASNLVPGDTNGVEDIFLRDTFLNTTVRASTSTAGVQADSFSESPAISADGAVVVFASRAANLAAGAAPGVRNIYAYSRKTGATSLVSVAFDGSPANGDSMTPSISGDGRMVAFASQAGNLILGDFNHTTDVFLADRLTRSTVRVSVGAGGIEANSDSDSPALSANGRFVAFRTYATNIAPNAVGAGDVALRDTAAGVTRLVSVGLNGMPADAPSGAPAVSADGRYVAFVSQASNLVPGDLNAWEDAFLRDTWTDQTTLLSTGSGGPGDLWSTAPAITPDAVYAAFVSYANALVPGDTNAAGDVFVRGPLAVPYAFADAQRALSIAAGLQPSSLLDLSRLNLDTAAGSAGRIDLGDAVRVARRAAGLDG